MRTLSDSDFLDIWECGFRRHPLDQALLMLGAALPETPYESLADWSLGRRNRALARLHCGCFGNRVHGWTACPGCGEKLEFEMDGRAFADTAGEEDSHAPIVVNERSFRLPTSRDLARSTRETDPVRASIRLIEDCLLDPAPPPAFTAEEVDGIGERMAEADPLAEIRLTLRCPSCAHAWEETLDIASFLWEKIEARGRRLLLEVHTLASAYGWTEAESLSLSDNRRAIYLAMVRS